MTARDAGVDRAGGVGGGGGGGEEGACVISHAPFEPSVPHGLGLNAVKPNRLFGVSEVSWQSCLSRPHTHTHVPLLSPDSLSTPHPWRTLLLLIS